MKQKALFMILTAKLRDNEIIFVDKMKLKEARTKEMKKALNSLLGVCRTDGADKIDGKREKSILVALDKKDGDVVKASANIPRTKVVLTNSLNVLDLLNHKYILMTEKSIEVIEKTFSKLKISEGGN